MSPHTLNTSPIDSSPIDVFDTVESEVRSYSRSWPDVFVRSAGAKQWGESGTEYIDFFAGAGALNYGHNNPAVIEPLIEYLRSGAVLHGLDMKTPAKREFLETFSELVLQPRGLDYKVMFPGPTGTNTVEAALKLARKVTGREHVMSFTNAFHGMTLGSLSITGNAAKRSGAGVPLTHTSRIPYDAYFDDDSVNDDSGTFTEFDRLERMLSDTSSGVDLPAAFIVETVQGEGGLRAARAEWLQRLARIATTYGVLLIIDDVQAGCGRTGTFFSFEDAGIVPDIVCLSKSISGSGLPLALTLFKPELDVWAPGEHNGTFRGNNPAFVTATAALKTYWSDTAFQHLLGGTIAHLNFRLNQIIASTPGSRQRGRGLLTGIVFDDPTTAGKVAATAYEHGLLVETSGSQNEVLKIMPPLTISTAELDAGCDILAAAITHHTAAPVLETV